MLKIYRELLPYSTNLENHNVLFCNLVSGGTNKIIIQYFMISNFII